MVYSTIKTLDLTHSPREGNLYYFNKPFSTGHYKGSLTMSAQNRGKHFNNGICHVPARYSWMVYVTVLSEMEKNVNFESCLRRACLNKRVATMPLCFTHNVLSPIVFFCLFVFLPSKLSDFSM